MKNKSLLISIMALLFFSAGQLFAQNPIMEALDAPPATSIASIDCAGATNNVVLYPGIVVVAGVTSVIGYTGGNGSAHAGQIVTSTGVTGLTASLASGRFATGSGTFTYTITGTPSSEGTASFAINIGGLSCTLNRTVFPPCTLKTGATTYLTFMCHNLGADTSLNPNVPVQGINGNYYQWGKIAPVATAATPAGAIAGWSTVRAAHGSWQDNVKTANDPCPAGYRVPTEAQWDKVVLNNAVSRTGTWSNSGLFGTAIHYGPDTSTKLVTLPAAGGRGTVNGTLGNRSNAGIYWSSTWQGDAIPGNAQFHFFASATLGNATPYQDRVGGSSVRCVKE